jgi:hypothetical protein
MEKPELKPPQRDPFRKTGTVFLRKREILGNISKDSIIEMKLLGIVKDEQSAIAIIKHSDSLFAFVHERDTLGSYEVRAIEKDNVYLVRQKSDTMALFMNE